MRPSRHLIINIMTQGGRADKSEPVHGVPLMISFIGHIPSDRTKSIRLLVMFNKMVANTIILEVVNITRRDVFFWWAKVVSRCQPTITLMTNRSTSYGVKRAPVDTGVLTFHGRYSILDTPTVAV